MEKIECVTLWGGSVHALLCFDVMVSLWSTSKFLFIFVLLVPVTMQAADLCSGSLEAVAALGFKTVTEVGLWNPWWSDKESWKMRSMLVSAGLWVAKLL